MKKNYLTLTTLALASIGFFAFQFSGDGSMVEAYEKSHRFSAGGMAQKTGAPGENDCTQCHSGTSQDGANENQLTVLDGIAPVTSYVPGTTYNVSLTMSSSPAKKGFSAVALDANNNNAGSFAGSDLGGTQDYTGGERHYVSHTALSNTSANMAWIWSWTAPETDAGAVTFYVASNAANNDGSGGGDVIYLSQHSFGAESSAGTNQLTENVKFNAGYNTVKNRLEIGFSYLSTGNMSLNLVDMNGRSVFTYTLGDSEIGENHESVALPEDINEGIYVVHFFVGNKAMSANVLVKK